MSIRPRYSLLALLLFTAAVAIGVKLWRGPHHVVDRSNPQMEDEYTYYRDWDGTKLVDGVRVRRYRNAAGNREQVNFDIYCHGEKLNAWRIIQAPLRMQQFADMHGTVQLSKVELEELNRLTNRELELIRHEGGDPFVFESWSLSQMEVPVE